MNYLVVFVCLLFATAAEAATVTVTPTNVAPGGTVQATMTTASPVAWWSLRLASAPNIAGQSIVWAATSTTLVNIVVPSTIAPGTYVVALFTGPAGASFTRLATSAPISIKPQFGLQTVTNGAGYGTITPSVGIYPQGTSVTVTSTPSPGSRFYNFACNAQNYPGPVSQIVMNGSMWCVATFTLSEVRFTSQTNGTGSGSITPSGVYAYGTYMTVNATPAAGSELFNLACDGVNYPGATVSFVLDDPSLCTATFMLSAVTELKTYRTYVRTPGVMVSGEFHPYCGWDAWIQVPAIAVIRSPAAGDYVKGYVELTGTYAKIRLGIIQRQPGKWFIYHDDREYPDSATPIALLPGQWVHLGAECCFGDEFFPSQHTWGMFYAIDPAGMDWKRIVPFPIPTVTGVGMRSGAVSQVLDVKGLASDPPNVQEVRFFNTFVSYRYAADATWTGADNEPLFCNKFTSVISWNPQVGVPTEAPQNAAPYDQHWLSPFYQGTMHKHQ